MPLGLLVKLFNAIFAGLGDTRFLAFESEADDLGGEESVFKKDGLTTDETFDPIVKFVLVAEVFDRTINSSLLNFCTSF